MACNSPADDIGTCGCGGDSGDGDSGVGDITDDDSCVDVTFSQSHHGTGTSLSLSLQ